MKFCVKVYTCEGKYGKCGGCVNHWGVLLSKVKFKTRWCNYLSALEKINCMPTRKDRCYKNYGSLHSLKGKV